MLRRDGAPALTLACAAVWLGLSGYTFAIILAAHAATGSFADAGAVSAAFAVGVAVLAPLRGRSVDARGPRALTVLAGAHLLCGAGLVAGCIATVPWWSLFVAAAAAGSTAPPVIATARSLWTEVAGPGLARTGHALNAALSDAAVIAGPGLVGAVAAALSPAVALASMIACTSGAALVVATLAATQRRPHTDDDSPPTYRFGPLRDSAGLRTLVAVRLPIGIWIGALDVAVTAVAARHGAAALGAVPLAAGAAGSCAASITSGSGRIRRPPDRRFVGGSLLVAATLPLTLIDPAPATLAAVLVLTGGGFGLLNVAAFELLDVVVHRRAQTEAFTWLTSANAAGSAIGAAAAGRLVGVDETAALLLIVGAAVTAAAFTLARQHSLA
ncbi:MAG TPA: MFS transporter [Solirubrobacteraceae bacterium]|nr:MFS transporter [Solirubrobacteraceae bacterium]